MTKMNSVKKLFTQRRQNPEYKPEYDALEAEFAERTRTTQSAIARMEGGKNRPSPSTIATAAAAMGRGCG